MRRYVKIKPSKENPIEQQWQAPITPTFLGSNHDPEEQHIPDNQIKKSMLSKVKDMGVKWRNSLVLKKKAGRNNVTPAWGVSLDDDIDNDDENADGDQHFGAPMYESELAQESNKDAAIEENKASSTNVTSQTIRHETHGDELDSDKGVVVKESLTPKSEPGEQKIILEVISDAFVPKAPKDMEVVHKGKDNASSLFKMESSSPSSSSPRMEMNMSNKTIPIS